MSRRSRGAIARRIAAAGLACACVQPPAQADPLLLPERADVAGARAQPEFDPVPIVIEPFRVVLQLRDTLAYDSNVYANGSGGDALVVVSPRASATADIGPAKIDLSGDVRLTRFFRLTDQNVEEYGARAGVAIDLDRWRLDASLAAARSAERRGDAGTPLATVGPSLYRTLGARGRVTRRLGAVSLSADLGWQKLRYNALDLLTGAEIAQDYRNSDRVNVGGELQYAPTSALLVGAYLDYGHSDAKAPPDRSNSELTVGGTFVLDLGMARLEGRAGYHRQDFTGSEFEDFGGLIYDADLAWYPTELVTVTLHARRGLDNSGVPTVGAIVSDSVRAELAWELLRNVVLRAEASHRHEDFPEVDATAHADSQQLSGEWRVNRSVALAAYARHLCRRSNVTESVRSYCAAIASLSVTLTP